MLTLNDGRSELWQWDTGRTLAVDADCSQVHFSNKVFGRSIDVDVIDGAAIIPDVLLQADKDLNVWAFAGMAENGYTKISKTFKVNRRNKPADYVFTPTDQMTLQTIQSQIGDLADLTTEAKDNLVAAINEAAKSGGGGSVQSDWNQNDTTQPDYVKNRPFYTGDPVETVLFEESTITFADAGGLYMASFPTTFEATVGETYKVSWDGTVYECTCVAVIESPSPIIGNTSIMGVGSDTGEPFIMAVVNGEVIQIVTADTSASHTFSISRTVVPVVKIDESYLPSTIPFMEDGKIPEKYVQERFPNVSDIFGGDLVISTSESTLANPYPNKTILHKLTVEAFNAMLNDQDSISRYVMVNNNVAEVMFFLDDPSTLYVRWSECVTYGRTGKPLAGAWVRAFQAKIHEDTDNPGTMVSECAVIEVANKELI